jgi:putative ABC transport system permease protein
MIVSRIAFRNLDRQKRRSFLLGGALAFGVAILMTVNGLVGGIIRSIELNFSDVAVGHIFFVEAEKNAKGKLVLSIKDDSFLLETIKKLGIEPTYVAKRSLAYGQVVANGESIQREISGVDWRNETQLGRSLKLLAGSLGGMEGSTGIVISAGMAEKLELVPKKEPESAVRALWAKMKGAERASRKADWDRARKEAIAKTIGETILVELNTVNGQQNLGEFQVKAVYEAQYDLDAYVDRDVLDSLMDLPKGGYNQFGMFIKDFSKVDAETARIHAALKERYDMVPMDKVTGKGFESVLSDLRKQNFTGSKFIITNLNNEITSVKSVFTIIQTAAFCFFVLLLLVIMVGITNTFRIVVWERTREIGTMRALGMQRREVRAVFLFEALFLSLAGSLAGIAFSSALLGILGAIKWNIMTELSFFMNKNHLMVRLDPVLLVGTLVLVSALTLLAAFLPARRAARMEPALALRTSY